MKIRLKITGLMFLLLVNIVLATDVLTDYSGKGDFELQTNIQSEITPTIYDSATIHTGCNGGCCCCPECSGSYEGFQFLTNNPFSIAIDNANITNGCAALEQTIYDSFDNRNVETKYYTYLDGSGNVMSYIYAKPGQGSSYQLSNGTGSAFVDFSQSVFTDGIFDYGTTYGGGVWVCGPGYAGMVSSYDVLNHNSYYDPELGLYCHPLDGSSLYAFLFAKTTDFFNLNNTVIIGSTELRQHIESQGSSDYGIESTSHDNLTFNFNMVLG